MHTITYNLRAGEADARLFYEVLEAYSAQVYAELDEQFYETLMDYFRFRRHEGLEQVYSLHEGYLEILALGVLWRVYSGDALATGDNATDLLQKLAELREENRHLKPLVDLFRGICLTSMMSPDLYDHMGVASPVLAHLTDLLEWLEATGEFKYEVRRLRPWERYVSSLREDKARSFLEAAISAGLWFEQDSAEELGLYTAHVERYLNERRPKRYWKEDVIFCGRRRVEYHLNMLGAEWLNTAYREAFAAKPQRLVLLPTCMRLKPEASCCAAEDGGWLSCTSCERDCAVFKVKQLAEDRGAAVYLVPHNSSLSDSPKGLDMAACGVIGVACVLNLISGGWMLAEAGIPAKCVLLDYCGCKRHWHHEGMPTDLCMHRLETLLA